MKWRAALDTYGVPYTYFADQKLREGNLRAKYDVIIFPHVRGSAQNPYAHCNTSVKWGLHNRRTQRAGVKSKNSTSRRKSRC